jgi:Flp pilus assembly protein TadD
MRRKTWSLAFVLAAALACGQGAALAVDDSPPQTSSEHEAGKRAIAAKDWKAALTALTAAEKREPGNADVHNLLGYAYRNTGQLDLALRHYARALQIDPRHLGAHEYVGEAHLMMKNLAGAEEHLASLKRYCPGVCEQRDDLEKAIAEYKRRSAAAK